MTLPLPTEENEQAAFVQYLELKGLKFTAIPNSTYTTSIKQKVKNMRTGLRPGLPDLLIIVNNQVIFIEMKRSKGGVISPAQQSWIDALSAAAISVYVCRGADQAIQVIEDYTSHEPSLPFTATSTF